jgi:predicted DNA-binding transcriptional regulator AlpA
MTSRSRYYRPAPPMPDPLLTALEVASALRCSKRTVQRLVSRGILAAPLHLSSQKRLWRTSTIRAFVEARSAAAQAARTIEAAAS